MRVKIIDVVAAIIEHQGKILLARRPESGDQPGLWEFPGGKVEAQESQQAALIRELKEELGIIAEPGRYVASQQHEVAGRIITLHAWHVTAFNGDITPLCHSALIWRTPHKAYDLDLAPADIPLLDAFIRGRDARPADGC